MSGWELLRRLRDDWRKEKSTTTIVCHESEARKWKAMYDELSRWYLDYQQYANRRIAELEAVKSSSDIPFDEIERRYWAGLQAARKDHWQRQWASNGHLQSQVLANAEAYNRDGGMVP